MGDELTNLLEIFKKFQKDGRQATLSFATNAGKTKIRLDLSLSPAESTPPASGGQRRRRRGPSKKAKAKARAALHQATLASASAADPVARGEEHVPVLKSPEKELSSRCVSPLKVQQRAEHCNTSGEDIASQLPNPEKIDCDECGEVFKCGEDLEEHTLWCPRCYVFSCLTLNSPSTNCLGCSKPYTLPPKQVCLLLTDKAKRMW